MTEQTLSPTLSRSATNAISETAGSGWSSDAGLDDFDYIPVSPWGPVSLFVGIAGITGFFGVFGLGLAFFGIIIGIVALIRIRADRGVVKGAGFAACGLILSVLCLSLGSVKMVHDYRTECPEGYLRVNFPNEISKREFIYMGNARRLHPEVAPLIGQKVFLKGFMWQTQASEGLRQFVFLKDNGECCFGGSPKPYDMMVVQMANNATTKAYTGMVSVGGVLNANVGAGEGEPVYTVDADFVEESRTRF